MAATLQAQWDATYGPTPQPVTPDVYFMQRVAMAMIAAALNVAAEGSAVTNHAARSAYATKVLNAPGSYMAAFAQAAAALGNDQTSTDVAIISVMGSVWNAMAGGL